MNTGCRHAGGVEGKACASGLEGEEMEVAGQEMFAGNFGPHEGLRREELDGVEVDEAVYVFVEGRERKLGNEVDTIGNAEGHGDDVIVDVGERGVAGAWAGVGVGHG